MKIILEINVSELEMKKAVAKGWNKRFDEKLTHKDIGSIADRDDIVCAIPYLDTEEFIITVDNELII